MLLGHSDSNGAQDTGYLKVSYHHNSFDKTSQRNPRTRFGEPVHIFNNYFLDNSDTGPACQAQSGDPPANVKALVTQGAGTGKV